MQAAQGNNRGRGERVEKGAKVAAKKKKKDEKIFNEKRWNSYSIR